MKKIILPISISLFLLCASCTKTKNENYPILRENINKVAWVSMDRIGQDSNKSVRLFSTTLYTARKVALREVSDYGILVERAPTEHDGESMVNFSWIPHSQIIHIDFEE